MKYTKKQIKEKLLEQLDEALQSVNGEIVDKQIIDLDIKNKIITVKLNFNIVEEDDYIGFGFY